MRKMKWLSVLGIVGVAVLSASGAHGGLKITKYALIENIPGGYRGSGALGSVRSQLPNAPTPTTVPPVIGCRIESGSGANGNMILCYITDQNNVQVNCLALDLTGSLTAAIAAMNGDSFLTFEVAVPPGPDAGASDASANDGSPPGGVPIQSNVHNGTCTLLQIENASSYYPKT